MNRLTNNSKRSTWFTALLMVAVAVGCSDSPVAPVVSPVDPGAGPGNGQPSAHGPAPVILGSAGGFVILAKSATSNVPTSTITGNIGLSPAAASFITGLALVLPAGGASSSSAQVTGSVFAADYAVPTPANLTTAIGNMQTAYTDAAGRPTPDHTALGAGNIGGLTLPPGKRHALQQRQRHLDLPDRRWPVHRLGEAGCAERRRVAAERCLAGRGYREPWHDLAHGRHRAGQDADHAGHGRIGERQALRADPGHSRGQRDRAAVVVRPEHAAPGGRRETASRFLSVLPS